MPTNTFSAQMKSKSDAALQQVVSDEDYTHYARKPQLGSWKEVASRMRMKHQYEEFTVMENQLKAGEEIKDWRPKELRNIGSSFGLPD